MKHSRYRCSVDAVPCKYHCTGEFVEWLSLLFLLVLERGFSLFLLVSYSLCDSFGWRVLIYYHSPVCNVYKLNVLLDSLLVLGCWFGFLFLFEVVPRGKVWSMKGDYLFIFILPFNAANATRGINIDGVVCEIRVRRLVLVDLLYHTFDMDP